MSVAFEIRCAAQIERGTTLEVHNSLDKKFEFVSKRESGIYRSRYWFGEIAISPARHRPLETARRCFASAETSRE